MRTAWRSFSLGVLVSLAIVSLPVLPAWAGPMAGGERLLVAPQTEPGAGSWPTWAIQSGSQFRLPPPPDKKATRAEMAELEELAAQRDAAALDRISYWDAGSPGYRWNELAIRHAQSKGYLGVRAARMLVLMNIAISDGTVAAWDTKHTYNRPRPAEFKKGFGAVLLTPPSPAYPSEHAVTAGAAATVLSYVWPADEAMFTAWAEEAGRSRLLAGTDYPSDVAAGLELGRQLGAIVVEWAKNDGSDARWDGTMPTGPGYWTGTNPIEPLTGTWKPLALTHGSQFRPGPRAAHDSAELRQELDEVKNYRRTNLSNLNAAYWEYFAGRAGFEYWNTQAGRKILEYRLDVNPPQAARIYALVSVAFHDVHIACWDAKFHYWAARPAQLDPTITTLFVTPNHPSYPSAHGCISSASGTVLAALFPREADYYHALIAEVSEARIAGGIHVRSDQVAGEAIGRSVAGVVLARGGV